MEKRTRVATRKKEDRLLDFEFIVPLFLKGQRFGEIAIALQAVRNYPVNIKMIYRDIEQILKGWKEERANLIPAAMEIQLRKLEKMEAVCWEQYEKSKTAKTRNVQKERSVFDKKANKTLDNLTLRQAEKHVTENIGDGQWLDRIFKCWEMQAELLDLKGNKGGGDDDNDAPAVTELVFITRTRKNNEQFTDAIEIPEEDGSGIQKLIQS